MSLSAIEGYRSAVNSVLRAAGRVRLLGDYRISDLFRVFGIERPVVRRLFPAWDLPLVLRFLREVPFEPMRECELSLLTMRTVFLLALASAKRCSELAALVEDPRHVRFARDYSSVTLVT